VLLFKGLHAYFSVENSTNGLKKVVIKLYIGDMDR